MTHGTRHPARRTRRRKPAKRSDTGATRHSFAARPQKTPKKGSRDPAKTSATATRAPASSGQKTRRKASAPCERQRRSEASHGKIAQNARKVGARADDCHDGNTAVAVRIWPPDFRQSNASNGTRADTFSGCRKSESCARWRTRSTRWGVEPSPWRARARAAGSAGLAPGADTAHDSGLRDTRNFWPAWTRSGIARYRQSDTSSTSARVAARARSGWFDFDRRSGPDRHHRETAAGTHARNSRRASGRRATRHSPTRPQS